MVNMLTPRIVFPFLIAAACACAQDKPEFAMGWVPEFHATARQVVQLAEAMPASKYSWRPGDGVRSVSEVYVHIAIAHMFFLRTCGVNVDASKFARDAEKKIVAKEDVVKFLKESIAAVDENYPKLDLHKKVKFQGADTTIEGVMIHLLAHTSEHMGQSVAYARVNGIVPPWSEPSK
jgi:uncharacterized damage-inducible protein DinB